MKNHLQALIIFTAIASIHTVTLGSLYTSSEQNTDSCSLSHLIENLKNSALQTQLDAIALTTELERKDGEISNLRAALAKQNDLSESKIGSSEASHEPEQWSKEKLYAHAMQYCKEAIASASDTTQAAKAAHSGLHFNEQLMARGLIAPNWPLCEEFHNALLNTTATDQHYTAHMSMANICYYALVQGQYKKD